MSQNAINAVLSVALFLFVLLFRFYRKGFFQFVKTKRERVSRLIVYSDLHATRFTLGLAEVLVTLEFFNPKPVSVEPLLLMGPAWLWASVVGVTAALQIYFLLRGEYNRKDAVVFAGWNALLWLYMNSLWIAYDQWFQGPQTALAVAASWVFIRSGCSSYGQRSSDYGGRRNVA